MMNGLRQSGRRLVGWGMFLWDWDWFRSTRPPSGSRRRIAGRAGPGSIIVLHDGHHKNPRADRRYTIETVDRLIPLLRAKGLEFRTICGDALELSRCRCLTQSEVTATSRRRRA